MADPPGPEDLELELLDGTFAVCRLPVDAPVLPPAGRFRSVTRTPDEVSVVCEEEHAPEGAVTEPGWRCMRLVGPLELSLTGIAAALTVPVAAAGVAVFLISTYETDYLLVKATALDTAIAALEGAGHSVAR